MASTKVQRIMTQPINLIFRFLQSKARIQIWLFEQKDLRIEGRIIGFDEYMNLVLDDAEEINVKKDTRKSLGRILLKGDNITLMMNTQDVEIATGDEDDNGLSIGSIQHPEGWYSDDDDGQLTWFNAGVRVGVGIGLGVCVGVGIGVGLLVSSYQATARSLKRRFF
uniref:Small nuclear ribonucleoprotein E n=1 Tax=Oryza punctata TaxID=4537 RepID=A0A0E0LR84_ORYPU